MTTPRICILTETYYPVVGGGETQARALAEGLVNLGLPVIVLTRRSDASLTSYERFGEIAVHRLPPAGPQHLKKWGLLLTCLPALVKLRRQYDVIFVSGYRVVGPSVVLIAKVLGKTCVLKADSSGEMSGEYFANGLAALRLNHFSLLFRALLAARNRVLRRAEAFVAISSEISAEHTNHAIEPCRIKHIPNGVDTVRFHPVDYEAKKELRQRLGILPKELILTYTGRLVSYKGLPLLLQVWREIQDQHPKAGLVLVGEGGLDIHNCEAELRRYVSDHRLDDSVQFTGGVQNVHEYLQASDIFVFPTENEAFGISLIEAMACGLPVISTPVGGVKDFLIDQENGLVVTPGDPRQLRAALANLIDDIPLSIRLGIAARRIVEERYSSESVTQAYVALFNHILNRRSRRIVTDASGLG